MPVSLSCARRALRRCTPSLSSATGIPFLERLRTEGALSTEEAERISRQPTELEKRHALVKVLCGKRTSATFEMFRKCLAMEGHNDLEELFNKEYESALGAPPDVKSSSYTDAMSLDMVPNLPKSYLPREPLARDLRDSLMEAEGERRLVAVTGGPGMGKTLLTSDVVRNEELYDYFEDGVVWRNIGPNETVKDLIKLLKKKLKKTDSSKTLLIFDDVRSDEILSAVTGTWKEIRVIITSQSKNILSRFKDKSVKSVHLKEGFTFQQCRQIFNSIFAERDFPLMLIDELQAECKGWPLGICTLAQHVKCDTQDGQTIEAALDQRLEVVRQKNFEEMKSYGSYAWEEKYDNWSNEGLGLSQPMSLSISKLTPLQLECVTSLAVLEPEQWISVEVLKTVWSHLDNDFTQNLRIEELLPSFLTVSSHEDYKPFGLGGSTSDAKEATEWKCKVHAHFRPVILQGNDENTLIQKHKQIVSNYEMPCSGTWGKLPEDGYIIGHLCYHLEQAGRLSDIPLAFSDFFFVEKMFRTCGLNATLDSVRRHSTCFINEADQGIRDNLISILESIACFGRNPRYQVSFVQAILQMSPLNPLVGWAEDAIRSHPQLLSQHDSKVWRLTSPRINRFRRQMPDKRICVPRPVVTNDLTYEVACIALDISRKLLVLVTLQNRLFVCDADNFDCKISGYRISGTDSFVQKVGVFSDNRRLLLLTEASILMCGHLRFSLDKLSHLAPHEDGKEVPVRNILPDMKIQSFVLRGNRLAVIDIQYNMSVFDLQFDHDQNQAPSMTRVVTVWSDCPQDCFAKEKIVISEMMSINTTLKSDLKQAARKEDLFEEHLRSEIHDCLQELHSHLGTLRNLMFETSQTHEKVLEDYRQLLGRSIFRIKHNQLYLSQALSDKFTKGFEFLISYMLAKNPGYLVIVSRFFASFYFWFSDERQNKRKKLSRLSHALTPPKIDMTQSGSTLALSTNISCETVKIFDISNDSQRTRLLNLPADVKDLKLFNCPKSSTEFIAVAYENIVSIWNLQDGVQCQQLKHDDFVLNFAIEQELCAVWSVYFFSKWRLSLPSGPEQLTTRAPNAIMEILISELPICLSLSAASLGQLRISKESRIGSVMSGVGSDFPHVLRVADKLFLASNFDDDGLILLEPHTRAIALIDMDNTVKSRAFAACDDAIFVGGIGSELVRYRLASDGEIGKRETLLKRNQESDDITALEFSPRGNLLIGIKSGGIFTWNEGQKLKKIARTNGMIVFLIALKQRSQFVSVSANRRCIEIHVWNEAGAHSAGCREIRLTVTDPSCPDFDTFLVRIRAYRPTISTKETFLAMLSFHAGQRNQKLITFNLKSGRECEVPHDFITKDFIISKVLFHPTDDHMLFIATETEIRCFRIDSAYSSQGIQQTIVLDFMKEFINSITFFDSDHIIISSNESVTLWNLSEERQLTDGRLILSGAQVKGDFYDTYMAKDNLLCVTKDIDSKLLHRACYPLVLQSDFLS